jgi:hypothetical protein
MKVEFFKEPDGSILLLARKTHDSRVIARVVRVEAAGKTDREIKAELATKLTGTVKEMRGELNTAG